MTFKEDNIFIFQLFIDQFLIRVLRAHKKCLLMIFSSQINLYCSHMLKTSIILFAYLKNHFDSHNLVPIFKRSNMLINGLLSQSFKQFGIFKCVIYECFSVFTETNGHFSVNLRDTFWHLTGSSELNLETTFPKFFFLHISVLVHLQKISFHKLIFLYHIKFYCSLLL